MKTTLSILGLMALSLTLTACQQSSPSQSGTKATPSQPVVQNDTPQSETAAPMNTAEDMDGDVNSDMTPDEATFDPAAETIPTIALSESVTLLNQFSLKDEGDFSACAYNAISNCQEQTANQVAQEKQDPSACDAIMNESQVAGCKNQLWYQLADIDSEAELCANITEAFLRESCESEVSINLAMSELKAELCDTIGDPYRLDDCKNQVAMGLASQALDVSLCENIVMYDYTYQVAETSAEEGAEIDPASVVEAEQEVVRTPLPADQNFMRQDCVVNVEMMIEMREAEEAAAAAAAEVTPEDLVEEEPS